MYELVFNSIAFIGIGTGTNCGSLHYFVLTEVKASSARATLAGARAALTFLEGTMDLSLTIRSMQFHFKLLFSRIFALAARLLGHFDSEPVVLLL